MRKVRNNGICGLGWTVGVKIVMLSYDMQDFGGLEEYAVNLAIGLKQLGHVVSHVSCAWVSPKNQYVLRLRANDISLIRPPKWISNIANDWSTKEKILRRMMLLLGPFVAALAVPVAILKRHRPADAWRSAYNFLRGQLMDNVIGPDHRRFLGRLLMTWWILRWHVDVLHVHGYTTSLMFALEWAHERRIPVVYEEHSTPNPLFEGWASAQLSLNKAARIVAVSEKSAQALREICGVTRPIAISGPLLPDPFQTGWHQNEKHAQSGKGITITTLARLVPEKGLDHLLQAIALVRKTHSHVRFRVYGDGMLRRELLSHAQKLGLDGKDIFVGAFTGQAERTQILSGTDIFLLPSILEGQPVVIVEAMAYGCPIVATNVGGIPELIRDGLNGLLCPPANPTCLAEKIKLLIENPELRSRLGAAARVSYEQGPFQIDTVSSKFVSIYEEVLREEVS